MRLLMLVVTLSAIACYWVFVRPTVIGRQFASLVEESNYRRAESMCVEPDSKFLTEQLSSMGNAQVKVELLSRQWSDIRKLRQRMSLQIIPKELRPDSKLLVGLQADLVATATGIEPPKMYPVIFGP